MNNNSCNPFQNNPFNQNNNTSSHSYVNNNHGVERSINTSNNCVTPAFNNNDYSDDIRWLENALQNPALANVARALLQSIHHVSNGGSVAGNSAATPLSYPACSPSIGSITHSPMQTVAISGIAPLRTVYTEEQRGVCPSVQGEMGNPFLMSSSDYYQSVRGDANVSPANASRTITLQSETHDNKCGYFSNDMSMGPRIDLYQQQQQLAQLQMNSINLQPFQYPIGGEFPNELQHQTQQQVSKGGDKSNRDGSTDSNQVYTATLNSMNYTSIHQNSMDNMTDDITANCRQGDSEEYDLSFLLDESTHPVDGNNIANDGATGPITIPNLSTASQPQKPSPASTPGSSQQMQEDLREIAQQHRHQAQMNNKNQVKINPPHLSYLQGSLHSTLDGSDLKSLPLMPAAAGVKSLKRGKGGSAKTEKGKLNNGVTISPQAAFSPTIGIDTELKCSGDTKIAARKKSDSSKIDAADPKEHQVSVVGGGVKRKRETTSATTRMPEMKNIYEYFESMVRSRGYTLKKVSAKELGYVDDPTPLQSASFGFAVCSSIKPGGAGRLSALLDAGLSPNPMNKFGDSPLFLACKRGFHELFKVFLDHGADVRVADGFGRTPLHHIAWSHDPCFTSAKIILEVDPSLICVADNLGKTPLDFVGVSNRLRWVNFLESIKDTCWPMEKEGTLVSPTVKHGGVSDPPDALSVELAERVASGHVLPEEARRLMEQEQSRNPQQGS